MGDNHRLGNPSAASLRLEQVSNCAKIKIFAQITPH
jgi:hypothetical protein